MLSQHLGENIAIGLETGLIDGVPHFPKTFILLHHLPVSAPPLQPPSFQSMHVTRRTKNQKTAYMTCIR